MKLSIATYRKRVTNSSSTRRTRAKTICGVAGAFFALTSAAFAQFDPGKALVQPEAIVRQFPDPATAFATPAFAPNRQTLTSHAEVFAFIDALSQRSESISIETVGHSQQGRAIALLKLTGKGGFNRALPTVFVIAEQHGNEPASGEAALALAQTLALERSTLLDSVNVLIMPRGNPDGSERFARVSASGADINRDHLLLMTPEARAIASVLNRYSPQVTLDLHEFTVGGRWIDKFGALSRYDALLQAATVPNLHPSVQATQARYLTAARGALEAVGHRVEEYHTSSPDAKDLVVSMGGVNADTGRNVGGLRHAVSILLETRGIGIGRAHLARRVQSHWVSALAIIELAAKDGGALVRGVEDAGRTTALLACTGTLAVTGRQTNQQRTLSFLDAKTGEPRNVEVLWRSSHQLTIDRERSRPCGYLIAPDQRLAVQRLRALGVEVTQLDVAASTAEWALEDYVVEADNIGARQDGRGAIADPNGGIRVLRVQLRATRATPPPGSYYVNMAQPLAALASAALEPDSQNSYVANRLLSLEGGKLRRVTQTPSFAKK
jgi:Zinc carboxypeptidase